MLMTLKDRTFFPPQSERDFHLTEEEHPTDFYLEMSIRLPA